MTATKYKLTMLSPIPEYRDQEGDTIHLAGRPETLDGLTIGLLPNWRPSALAILDSVGGLLQEKFDGIEFVKHQPMKELPFKDSGLVDPLGGVPDELTRQADVVLTATGD